MGTTPPVLAVARNEFEALIITIRPKLHRYCARMTGSVVDAEDVVQDALAKAYYQLSSTEVGNLEGWLLRIVHNKAVDYLRKAKRSPIDFVEEYPPQADVSTPLDSGEVTTFALSIYIQLTPIQRSCVILKDVLGYSLEEVSELLDISVGGVKAALNRGRANLRTLVETMDLDSLPAVGGAEIELLAAYADRFNARDFEAVKTMLADDVRLDMVERNKTQGAAVGLYFGNYSNLKDLRLAVGFVDRKPALLVADVQEPDRYLYIILLQWHDEKIRKIRDYRYAPLVMQDADIIVLGRDE